MAVCELVKTRKGKDLRKGFMREVQRWKASRWEDSPSHEGMRRGCGWGCAGGYSSTPLQRLLEKSIGRKWEDLVCKIPPQLWDSLRWMFSTDVVENDGMFESVRGSWRLSGYFVDKAGILRRAGKPFRRYRRPVRVREVQGGFVVVEALDVVVVGEKRFVCRGGFWYEHRLVRVVDESVAVYGELGEWTGKYVSRPREVFQDFQVSGDEQKELNRLVRG